MSKRSKEKYPALKKKYNLKFRRDYIESQYYIDGVKNEKGELVIRAMTDEEKAWLNEFNAETVCCDYRGEDHIYPIGEAENLTRAERMDLKREIVKEGKSVEETAEKWGLTVQDVENIMERKKIANEDYNRKWDLHNVLKSDGRLVHFDQNQFDHFTAKKLDHIDPELIILHDLEKYSKES